MSNDGLEPRRLSDSLRSVLRDQGLEGAQALSVIGAHWAEIVGEETALHVHLGAMQGTELVLLVDHPAWTTEVKFMREHILSGFENCVGKGVVTEIKVHVRA